MEINCPNCNKALELPDNAVGVKVRCSFCRATFIGEEPAVSLSAPAGSGSKFCPNCGAHTVAGFKFCANCGQSLGASKPVKVASCTPSATVDCVVCGKHMRESSAVKCPRCGNNVCKTHYNKKLDVCSQCVPTVMGELADKAVAVGESGDWTQALAIAKQCDKTDGRVLYVFSQSYVARVPTLAYHSWEYNVQKHWEYMEASANAGYPPAQYQMGSFHCRNCDSALIWLEKAAEQEYVPAQMEIAKCAKDGYGLTVNGEKLKDLVLSFKWYKRAAENGDPEACFQVSQCCLSKAGTPYDPEMARQWLVRAAEKGHPKALCRLGDEYRTGSLCTRDLYKALDCYVKSAGLGCGEARKYMLRSVAASKYVAIDLRAGHNAERYPIVELNEYGDNVLWGDDFKTDFLLLRRVDAGVSMMGRRADCRVEISKAFYLGVFEVTQRQWELVVGNRPAFFKHNGYYMTRPVENIARKAILDMIDLLQKRTNLEFGLPTSAQWEFACRAGTVSPFNNGLRSIANNARVGMDRTCSGCEDLSYGTAKVGTYSPNAWGLYDMHGNVSELCSDEWGQWKVASDSVDPVDRGPNGYGCLRGGCWASDECYGESGWVSALSYSDLVADAKTGFRLMLAFEEWDSPRLADTK